MRHAVFEGRTFRRFEIEPGVLEPGYLRVPVTVNPQPPQYEEGRHFLKSYAILNDDMQSAAVVYTLHEKPPMPAAESTPQSLRPIIIQSAAAPPPPPVDLSPLERQLRELMEAVADIASANLRMQQELAEAQQVIGALARIICLSPSYSPKGEDLRVRVPTDQLERIKRAAMPHMKQEEVQAFQEAMERAA